MKIAIDGRVLSGKRGGIRNYATNLVENIPLVDDKNSYALFVNERFFTAKKQNLTEIETSVSTESHPLNELWINTTLPLTLKKLKADVFFTPAFWLPFLSPKTSKCIAVHDLVVFLEPEHFPDKFSVYLRAILSTSIRLADSIIAVSENTKKDLLKLFRIPEKKITVVHHGVAPEFRPREPGEMNNLSAFGIKTPYILFVGTIEPRKNVCGAVLAFERIKKKHPGLSLVIVGAKGWLYEDSLRAIENSPERNSIIWLKELSYSELPSLYRNATLFLYPSFYEGFGLPVIEAMASGVPVVTSNTSSLPEVAGNAALLVDPNSVEDISAALGNILSSSETTSRLGRAGIEHASRFKWDRTAKETILALEKTIK